MSSLFVISVFVAAFLIAETLRASKNERIQRARGGIEPAGDVYRWMQIAYPGFFAAMLAEGAIRGGPPAATLATGAAVFAAAKALKWWAILTLGSCWTFRVIVVPGSERVVNGPYRLLRHPNYVAVVGELAGVALMTGAVVVGPLAVAAFGVLLIRRIRVEDRALRGLSGT